MDTDELNPIRGAFYIGDWVSIPRVAKQLSRLSGFRSKERDSYVARSLIAQKKFDEARALIGDDVSTPFLAVKQLLEYMQATSPEERALVLEGIQDYLQEDAVRSNTIFCCVVAQIYIEEGSYKDAVKLLSQNDEYLETLLMQVQVFIRMNRPDLGEKVLGKMKDIDDDDPLTIFASAQICLAMPSQTNAEEAISFIDELSSRINKTCTLSNMEAAAHLHACHYGQAWTALKAAKEYTSKLGLAPTSETIINSIVCLQHANKNIDRIPGMVTELAELEPEHEFLRKSTEMESLFDKYAQNYHE